MGRGAPVLPDRAGRTHTRTGDVSGLRPGASAAAVVDVGVRARSARRTVGRLDRRMTRRVVRAPGRSPLGPGHLMGRRNALPTWGVMSVGLATLGPRGRRAARRGLVAATTSSLLGDRLLKPAIGRQRPESARRASASLPSGHACTGSAYATAVACEWPAAGVVAGATSLLVSTGRVRDGEHHVLDVVTGTAFGVTVALVLRALTPSGATTAVCSTAAAPAGASPPGEGRRKS